MAYVRAPYATVTWLKRDTGIAAVVVREYEGLFNVLGMVYAMVSISIVGFLVWAH